MTAAAPKPEVRNICKTSSCRVSSPRIACAAASRPKKNRERAWILRDRSLHVVERSLSPPREERSLRDPRLAERGSDGSRGFSPRFQTAEGSVAERRLIEGPSGSFNRRSATRNSGVRCPWLKPRLPSLGRSATHASRSAAVNAAFAVHAKLAGPECPNSSLLLRGRRGWPSVYGLGTEDSCSTARLSD